MNRHTVIGVAICFALFIGSFFLSSGSFTAYWNFTALLVVASGTIGSALISSGAKQLRDTSRVILQAFREERPSIRSVVTQLLYLSVKTRRGGVHSLRNLQQSYLCPQLEQALELIRDNYKEDEVSDILGAEMTFYAARERRHERLVRNMANYAPSFGVAGSVIGLIGLLMGIGETELILKSIPIALISTFYGVIASNFFLTPTAERLRERLESELLVYQVVLEGAVTLARESNVHKLLTKLNALIPPEDRINDPQIVKKLHQLSMLEDEEDPDLARIDEELASREQAKYEDDLDDLLPVGEQAA